MDPISLVVTALTAGAVAATQGTMTSAAADGYQALKSLVLSRFTSRDEGASAVRRLADDPAGGTAAVTAELERSGTDQALVEAAQRLMSLIDTQGTREGRYRVDARGAQGVQVSEHGTQSNVFYAPPSA